MPRKTPGRGDQLRLAIAEEAARIMAEQGIQDFGFAKRKAAERYGVSEGSSLPRNTEIEAALLARQRLFGGATHEQSLQQQRRTALKAMQLLERFEPRLVGAVLTGSSTPHSDIQLHVFSDSSEAVYLRVLENGYACEVLERKLRVQGERQASVPSVRFEIRDETVEAFVFPEDGIRQAPPSPVDGRPMRRADIAEVSGLVDD
jgi:hypothetical protein